MDKMFPIQLQRGAKPHPLLIPWSVAELAYSVYAGRYGTSQSLERLAQRGGFCPGEMDDFLSDWRERTDALLVAQARIEELEAAIRDYLTASGCQHPECIDEDGITLLDMCTEAGLCAALYRKKRRAE